MGSVSRIDPFWDNVLDDGWMPFELTEVVDSKSSSSYDAFSLYSHDQVKDVLKTWTGRKGIVYFALLFREDFWISNGDTTDGRAFRYLVCRYCNSVISAQLRDIQVHLKTVYHLRNKMQKEREKQLAAKTLESLQRSVLMDTNVTEQPQNLVPMDEGGKHQSNSGTSENVVGNAEGLVLEIIEEELDRPVKEDTSIIQSSFMKQRQLTPPDMSFVDETFRLIQIPPNSDQSSSAAEKPSFLVPEKPESPAAEKPFVFMVREISGSLGANFVFTFDESQQPGPQLGTERFVTETPTASTSRACEMAPQPQEQGTSTQSLLLENEMFDPQGISIIYEKLVVPHNPGTPATNYDFKQQQKPIKPVVFAVPENRTSVDYEPIALQPEPEYDTFVNEDIISLPRERSTSNMSTNISPILYPICQLDYGTKKTPKPSNVAAQSAKKVRKIAPALKLPVPPMNSGNLEKGKANCYNLKWNNFDSKLTTMFVEMLKSGNYCDVTLWCEGKIIRCHKIILIAGSIYFEQLFNERLSLTGASDQEPIIFLKDMHFSQVQYLVEFMYTGKLFNISKENMVGILNAAESLQVKGISMGLVNYF